MTKYYRMNNTKALDEINKGNVSIFTSQREGIDEGNEFKYSAKFGMKVPNFTKRTINFKNDAGEDSSFNLIEVSMTLTDTEDDKVIRTVPVAVNSEMRPLLEEGKFDGEYAVSGVVKMSKADTPRPYERFEFRLTPFE